MQEHHDRIAERGAVPERFDRVASRYDLLCRLNPGYRRHLTLSARRMGAGARDRIVDLCCGTGLSTEAIRRIYPEADITAVDASAGMLEVAKDKPLLKDVRFVLGDAGDPATVGVTGPYDGALVAYGVRNMPDPDLFLRRLHALLRPGGVVAIHEYTLSGAPLHQAVWGTVSSAVVVPLGTALTGSGELFRYLKRSVVEFDRVDALCHRMERAGFTDVEVHHMDGWQRGIVHTVVARRPEMDDGEQA